MTERRVLGLSVFAAILIVALVRALDVPIQHLGQALAAVLRADGRALEMFVVILSGMPGWLHVIDNLVAGVLLALAFLGGLPIGDSSA